MNYIKEAELYLHNYRDLRESVGTMQKELGRLIRSAGPRGDDHMAARIDIAGKGKGGGAGQYDDALNCLLRIKTLQGSIAETETMLAEIDWILEDISRTDADKGDGTKTGQIDEETVILQNYTDDPHRQFFGQVLRMWYVDKLPKEDIAEALGYETRRTIYLIRDQAIRVFAVRVLGLGALDAM